MQQRKQSRWRYLSRHLAFAVAGWLAHKKAIGEPKCGWKYFERLVVPSLGDLLDSMFASQWDVGARNAAIAFNRPVSVLGVRIEPLGDTHLALHLAGH